MTGASEEVDAEQRQPAHDRPVRAIEQYHVRILTMNCGNICMHKRQAFESTMAHFMAVEVTVVPQDIKHLLYRRAYGKLLASLTCDLIVQISHGRRDTGIAIEAQFFLLNAARIDFAATLDARRFSKSHASLQRTARCKLAHADACTGPWL